MTNDPNISHLWTLLKEAHNDSLDNICSHPLTAEQIEDLAEDLGFIDYAYQLKDYRKEKLNDC
jgi:hypothetical protein|tara:strand:- start:364 stop:552 length:189 start_codon:yes stop_codon:yes gene_type:complete